MEGLDSIEVNIVSPLFVISKQIIIPLTFGLCAQSDGGKCIMI